MTARPSAVFVSYDGALDPLGATQVLPYLRGLAAEGVDLTLLSFEKPERWADRDGRHALARRLQADGIAWRPLSYHRRPRLPATAWDLAHGAWALRQELRRRPARLVHCRGEVAMAMARLARLPPEHRILHDMRALFSEERVASGSWSAGGTIDRLVKRVESGNLRRADGLVVLSENARARVVGSVRPGRPVAVIPTCVDLDAFQPRAKGAPPTHGLVYSGALGASYMAAEIVEFMRRDSPASAPRALFLTPQEGEARRAGADPSWADVRAVEPSAVPPLLRGATALVFFRRPSPANLASCPTKTAEALASGLPVVCNRGIGDLDRLLPEERVGVLVDEFSSQGFTAAARALAGLLGDPGLAARCRRVAEERFGLPLAVAAYHRLYRELGDARS